MDSIKKLREILPVADNLLWLLISNLLVLAGISGLIITVTELIKYAVDNRSYAIFAYIFVAPFLIGYSIAIFVPTIIGKLRGMLGLINKAASLSYQRKCN